MVGKRLYPWEVTAPSEMAELTDPIAPVGDDLKKPCAEERNLEGLLVQNLEMVG